MTGTEVKGLSEVQELLRAAPREAAQAASAAVNRTLIHVRAGISKGVRAEYYASAKEIKGTIKLSKATQRNLSGVVRSTGRPLPLSAFRVTQSKNRPLKAKVKRGGPPKVVRGLFSGRSLAGYKGLLHRYSRARYPLRVPYGPAVPEMIGNESVIQPLAKDAEEYLSDRFMHELEHRLK